MTAIQTTTPTVDPTPVVTRVESPLTTETPEEVVTALLTFAEYAYLNVFMANHERLPATGERRGLLLAFAAKAHEAYMLRPDMPVTFRVDLAAQTLAADVARAIERARAVAHDELS